MTTKEEYQQKIEEQLKEWQANIDKMKAKAEELEASARTSYQKQLEHLKAMQDEAWEQFERMQSASEEAWNDLKDIAEEKWEEFEEAVKSAMSMFK